MMCGIAGIYNLTGVPVELAILEAMTQVQAHRGPDGEGYVLLSRRDEDKPVAVQGRLRDSVRSTPQGYTVGFGHRRLAILDRSSLGHQPMSSEDGRVWITYNGEIYNYLELRDELRSYGRPFRSLTDTEVALQAYEQWGPDCLDRFNGMFAFAIWDGRRKRLFCARDRFGMKPFYYRVSPYGLSFGSEIKALLQDTGQPSSPNLKTIHAFLLLGLQDHSQETFFEGIQQLLPGHALMVEEGRIRIQKWWDLPQPQKEDCDDRTAAELFQELFEDSIRLHLRSDVAVGSCLSGGLDSSSIVCTMRRILPTHPIKTFSSCFEEPDCDERPYLRAVVAQTGVESVEVFPDGRRLFDDMSRILWFQEEPFGSTSFLAQWAVMKTASEHGMKVLLDGQGGDELLCGYPGYWGSFIGDLFRGGRVLKGILTAYAYWQQQSQIHPTVLANFARAILPNGLVSRARFRLKSHEAWVNPDFANQYPASAGYPDRFRMALDDHIGAYLQTHSLPALLHHEDRNAMAFSIEARLPFLDTRIVDCLARWPATLKLRDGMSKFVLRQAMTGIMPELVRTRTDKMGFVTPQDRWLRATLRPELESLFLTSAFAQRGYWQAKKLKQTYDRYWAGDLSIGGSVWRWVCLELWHQRFFP